MLIVSNQRAKILLFFDMCKFICIFICIYHFFVVSLQRKTKKDRLTLSRRKNADKVVV